MSTELDRFVAAGPAPLRSGLRLLVTLARRPRGARLLRHLPRVETPVLATLSLGRYDDPAVGRALGWDAAAVVVRGRALRQTPTHPPRP